MSLQNEYNYLRSGGWVEHNPATCPCGGTGWLLSDLDTRHECHAHSRRNLLENCRDYYRVVRRDTLDMVTSVLNKDDVDGSPINEAFNRDDLPLTSAQFDDVCRRESPQTPKDWCRVAGGLLENLSGVLADIGAQARGYSCALEERWDNDARDEAMGYGY